MFVLEIRILGASILSLHSNKVRDEEMCSWEFYALHCLILTVFGSSDD